MTRGYFNGGCMRLLYMRCHVKRLIQSNNGNVGVNDNGVVVIIA